MSDPFAIHRELTRTFRFYIALTVFANLGYAFVFAASLVAAMTLPDPYGYGFLIVPGMISTGFAALSAYGVPEAIGLHRAIQATGSALELPHVTRSMMLPVQTTLTLIFHTLIAFTLFATVFFTAIGW
ncbi:MAG: hypothetical protein AAGB11_07755 [Pseudomonadota bacterium]